MNLQIVGFIYAVLLVLAGTVCIILNWQLFTEVRRPRTAIRGALQLSAIFYPLALGVLQASSHVIALPRMFWRSYLLLLALWMIWLLLGPRKNITWHHLNRLRENRTVAIGVTLAILIMVLAVIPVSRLAF